MTKKNLKKRTHVVKDPAQHRPNARIRLKPRYVSFKLHKKVKHPAPPLPNWRSLTKKTFSLLSANRRNIARFFVMYGFIYFIFVRGLASPVDIDGIRSQFQEVLGRDISSLAVNFSVLALMLESTTSASGEVQGMYQVFFFILAALALIWLFRQQQAGNAVTMKEAFYRGMYPLVPFMLVLIVILLQTVPASIGNYLFSTVLANNLAINLGEQLAWLLFFLLLLLLSAYLLTSSIIALFVVTLPEMTPSRALKKAKLLVEFRRFSIMKKMFGLVFVVIALFIAIVFPAIFVSTLLAQILYFVLSVLFVPFIVGYLFVLYRELL